MRSITSDQARILAAAAGYGVRFRVELLQGATWRDLSTLAGHDWLDGAEYSASVDEPVSSATVTVRREIGDLSLAPLRTSSRLNALEGTYDPLIREGRRFRVLAACVPLGMEPTAGAWLEVFDGSIDELNAAEEPMTFTGRDYGGARLQDAFIRVERNYGSEAGTPVEAVMQAILTDNGVPFTLEIPAGMAPGWNIKPFRQQREPVAAALATLASAIGWETRYRWHADAWRLCFQEPQRTKTTPDLTLSADDYETISTARTSITEIRNIWEIVYSDVDELDPTTGRPGARITVTRPDAASIAAYGERWAEIAEDSTSPINTRAEAERMADAALADTKDVLFEQGVEIAYRPDLELGDLVRLLGNGVHYDGDQAHAIVSISHSLADARTTLTLRGKPGLGSTAWLEKEARPGLGKSARLAGPYQIADPNIRPNLEGLTVTYQPPKFGPRPEEFEVHVSTSSGFAPSAATLASVAKATTIEVGGLEPGREYFVRIIPRTAEGNAGDPSPELAATPATIQAKHFDPASGLLAGVPNGSFEELDANGTPRHWTFTAEKDFFDAFAIESGPEGAGHGRNALAFLPVEGTNTAISAMVPIPSNIDHAVRVRARFRAAELSPNAVFLGLRAYDADGISLDYDGTGITPNAMTTGWTAHAFTWRTIPAAAAFVSVEIRSDTTPPLAFSVDGVTVEPAPESHLEPETVWTNELFASTSIQTDGDVTAANNVEANNEVIAPQVRSEGSLLLLDSAGIVRVKKPLDVDPGSGPNMSIIGGDHTYLQFYPRGIAGGRKAWFGWGGAGGTTMALQVEDSGGLTLNGGTGGVTIAQRAWQALTLQNGWVRFDTDHPQPAAILDANGFVHLRGLLKSGTMGALVAQLPVGLRPSWHMHFAAASNGGIGVVRIDWNGNIFFTAGSNVYFSIDGLTFRPGTS